MLYTWGYAGSRPADLTELVERLGVTAVIDCRSSPTTRVPGFGTNQLAELLGERYAWKGDDLGGRGRGVTRAGLSLLRTWLGTPAVLLAMCMERAPGECHRHHTIGDPLAREGFPVFHVYREGPRTPYEVILATELQRAIDDDDGYSSVSMAEHLRARSLG